MRIYLLLFIASLFLVSCTGNKHKNYQKAESEIGNINNTDELSSLAQEAIKNRCITDKFAQGRDEHLYGTECIKNKHLIIETSKTGQAVSTSHSVDKSRNNPDGLRFEEPLDFINKVYNPNYRVLNNQGDDQRIPFLKDFLHLDERLLGSLDTKYRIVFKMVKNYLVLYKASQNIKDIPYVERTSLVKENGWYMVPFLGYPVEYCKPETIQNVQGEDTFEYYPECSISHKNTAKYIRVDTRNKQLFKYEYDKKKDFFPSEYFKGRWFVSTGVIEAPDKEGHMSPFNLFLTEIKPKSGSLEAIDVSNNITERRQKSIIELPVSWQEYEQNKYGEQGRVFGETLYSGNDPTTRKHLSINFNGVMKVHTRSAIPSDEVNLADVEVVDVLVSKDFFSFTFSERIRGHNLLKIFFKGIWADGLKQKVKVSFLRENTVDTTNFKARKWFLEDHNYHFGILPVTGQYEKKAGEHTEEDSLKSYRMMRFNTNNNSNNIKFYFSKNSTKDPYYRNIVKEALDVWNQAFAVITKDSDKKVSIELIEGVEKDLGDIRYNVVNLVKTEDVTGGTFTLEVAPSYVHPETGQTIGSTNNIFVHNNLEQIHRLLKTYIRYEIFQKDKHKNKSTVTPYLQSKIEKHCPKIGQFIANMKKQKAEQGLITPQTILGDKQLRLECGKTLSHEQLLAVILHGFGHNFGLSHNFKASVDKDNYYESLEDMRNYFPSAKTHNNVIPQLSSVMDYIETYLFPKLNVLGKYDLAALKYLYLDQIETKDGQVASLTIPEELDNQRPLSANIISQMKPYLHCSDFIAGSQDFTSDIKTRDMLCRRWDYGSSPLEIVQNDIKSFKRSLEMHRYRYDSDPDQSKNFVLNIRALLHITSFYSKWLSLRDQYLRYANAEYLAKHQFSDSESYLTTYQKVIREGVDKGANKEYGMYYAIREPVFNFLNQILFMESMKCEVKENATGKTHLVNLESLKEEMYHSHDKTLYVEDCHSPDIVNFLAKQNLTLTGQKGFENFAYYRPLSNDKKWDTRPIVASWYVFLTQPARFISFDLLMKGLDPIQLVTNFMREPDFNEQIRIKLETRQLGSQEGKGQTELANEAGVFSAFIQQMQIDLQPDYTDILEKNINHLTTIGFSIGGGRKGVNQPSFYDAVTKPLLEGQRVESLRIPFLTEAYKEYLSLQNHALETPDDFQKFQQWVMDKKETIDGSQIGISLLVVPFQKNNFAEKMIKKYNENRENMERLNAKRMQGLSLLERLELETMKNHNDIILQAWTRRKIL